MDTTNPRHRPSATSRRRTHSAPAVQPEQEAGDHVADEPLEGINLPYAPGDGPPPPSIQKRLWDEWLKGEIQREELWRSAQRDWHTFQKGEVEFFKAALAKAARTYMYITRMSVTLFVAGLGLFLSAAIYPLAEGGSTVYPAIFGGLGTATFLTMFIFRPFEKTQTALSNLLQAEICFMNTFSLAQQWTRLADSDSKKLMLSTTAIERLTADAVELLQRNLEPPQKNGETAEAS